MRCEQDPTVFLLTLWDVSRVGPHRWVTFLEPSKGKVENVVEWHTGVFKC